MSAHRNGRSVRDLVTCDCGASVRRVGFTAHRRTQVCIADRAVKRFRAANWTEVGYFLSVKDAMALGVPTEKAATRRTGNSYRGTLWWPSWAREVLNNWPGKEGARAHESLLRALIVKLRDDPETRRAWAVCWESWMGVGVLSPEQVVDFARAAVGSVDADAEVSGALQALHRALLRRSYG